jgi:hypothetical protein
MEARGDEVRIECSSADLTTVKFFSLFSSQGVARTLLTTERLVITNLTITTQADIAVTLYEDRNADDTVDAGERIVVTNGEGTFPVEWATPYYCAQGILPEAVAGGAGQTDICGTGFIQGT